MATKTRHLNGSKKDLEDIQPGPSNQADVLLETPLCYIQLLPDICVVDIPPIPERLLRLAKKYKPLPTDEELKRIEAKQKIKARLDSRCRVKKKKKKTSTIQEIPYVLIEEDDVISEFSYYAGTQTPTNCRLVPGSRHGFYKSSSSYKECSPYRQRINSQNSSYESNNNPMPWFYP
uniref:Uncharacterized protein n=1 Tax=Acrobeloides nanus TaxID=290746 RepID=A0A914C2X6_9BILA